MVLFLCRNKSSQNWTKLFGDLFQNKKKYWSQEPPEGVPWLGTIHQGAPPPPGAPWWVVPTMWPH